MSTSEKQLIANRQNAQKSTGPKTEAGKKKSSQNAVKHGLHSYQIAINSRRLIAAETAEINKQLQPQNTFLIDKEDYFEHFENSGELEDLLNSRTIPDGETANRFLRYEWRLNRELHHAYTLLRLLKIMEKVEAKSENALTDLTQTEPKRRSVAVPRGVLSEL